VIALGHHERWDGGGYPQGLQGEDIPFHARIAGLADVVDALGSDRPYRPAWEFDRVRTLVEEESGRHFDPEVAGAYRRLVEKGVVWAAK
jgi:HD-GYP domain-containing protein (c-di-GMP phosphodiesterase class II)